MSQFLGQIELTTASNLLIPRHQMKYDFGFFEEFSRRRRKLFGSQVAVESPMTGYFGSARAASDELQGISGPEGDVFCSQGAYFKAGGSIAELDSVLSTKLPADFAQFHEEYGESLIVTRSEPILLYPTSRVVADYLDDVDEASLEGRFFRFACYQDPLYLGLRLDGQNKVWEVVRCTYGLLYSEMVAPQGRRTVVAPSFYQWLRHLVDSDGFPDEIYPRDGFTPYHEVLE